MFLAKTFPIIIDSFYASLIPIMLKIMLVYIIGLSLIIDMVHQIIERLNGNKFLISTRNKE